MNILIADDERLVRLGLIHMLNELYPEQLTFAEARNGMELLQLAKEFLPDLIFIDIKMPLLDGLSAMAKLQESGYCGPFLILSGFSEFEYAKEAIKLGAVDYLLKPVSPEHLKESMEHAFSQIRLSYHHKNSLFSLHLLQLLSCHDFIALQQSSSFPCEQLSLNGCLFFFDVWEKEKRTNLIHQLSDQITKYGKKELDLSLYYTFLLTSNGDPIFLFQDCPQRNDVLNALLSFLEDLCVPAFAFCFCSCSIHHILSKIAFVQEYAPMRILFTQEKLIFLETLSALCEEKKDLLRFCQLFESLCFSCIEKNRAKCLRLISELKDPKWLPFFSDHFFFEISSYVTFLLPDFAGVQNRNTLFSAFDSFLYSDYFSQKGKGCASLVSRIQRYLEEHYKEDLSIESVSALFHLSPNYLSRVFHEHAGCRFTQYLTSIRIEKASYLLKNRPSMPIKDIAEAVGYYSPRYFSKIFYDSTGMLPSEYRIQD